MDQDQDIILSEHLIPEGKIVIKDLGPVWSIVGNDQLDLGKSNIKRQAKLKGGNAVVGFVVEQMPGARSIKVWGTALMVE